MECAAQPRHCTAQESEHVGPVARPDLKNACVWPTKQRYQGWKLVKYIHARMEKLSRMANIKVIPLFSSLCLKL
jgi:hypothetical protein